MKEFRINNISCRKYPDKKRRNLYEIAKWSPNIYFDKLNEYLSGGWSMSVDGYFIRKGDCHIDLQYFTENIDSYFVIAWLRRDRESWYLESVGERILDLNPDELKSFMEVYRKANEKLNKSYLK